LHNHFEDKLALTYAVIDVQSKFVLAREQQRLCSVKTLTGLRRRRDALVQANSLQGGSYGCAQGLMSIELSDDDVDVGGWEQFAVVWEPDGRAAEVRVTKAGIGLGVLGDPLDRGGTCRSDLHRRIPQVRRARHHRSRLLREAAR
jgi:hypothetical protein